MKRYTIFLQLIVISILFACNSAAESSKVDEQIKQSEETIKKTLAQTDTLLELKKREIEETKKLNDEIAARKKEVVDNMDKYLVLKVENKSNSTFGDNLYNVAISIENKSDYLIDDVLIMVTAINYQDKETDNFNTYSKAILPHSKNRIEIGDIKNASNIKLTAMAVGSKALGLSNGFSVNN